MIPPTIVIASTPSLKKKKPIKVAKTNFENSKGMILVKFERLKDLVQQKLPNVPNTAKRKINNHTIKLSGKLQKKTEGIKVSGVIKIIMKNIIEKTDSVLVRSLTIRPVIA